MAEFGYLFRLSYRYWAKILPYACPYLWEVPCHLEIRDIFMPLQKKQESHIYNFIMDIILEPKSTVDAYSTPIIQQTPPSGRW